MLHVPVLQEEKERKHGWQSKTSIVNSETTNLNIFSTLYVVHGNPKLVFRVIQICCSYPG